MLWQIAGFGFDADIACPFPPQGLQAHAIV
jgi:hypothetical protein